MNKTQHLFANQKDKYFTRSKFMNDFSEIFDDCPKSQKLISEGSEHEQKTFNANIKGHFDREKYEENTLNYGVQKWRQLLDHQDIAIWEVPFVRDTYDEDNDTTESEESEEEKDSLSTML